MAFALIGFGLHIALWPTSIVTSRFSYLLDVASYKTLLIFYLTVGLTRVAALYMNGKWPFYGAIARAIASVGGATVWFQMGVSLVLTQKAIGAYPSPAVSLYVALFGAELYSTYRAATDVRFR